MRVTVNEEHTQIEDRAPFFVPSMRCSCGRTAGPFEFHAPPPSLYGHSKWAQPCQCDAQWSFLLDREYIYVHSPTGDVGEVRHSP